MVLHSIREFDAFGITKEELFKKLLAENNIPKDKIQIDYAIPQGLFNVFNKIDNDNCSCFVYVYGNGFETVLPLTIEALYTLIEYDRISDTQYIKYGLKPFFELGKI